MTKTRSKAIRKDRRGAIRLYPNRSVIFAGIVSIVIVAAIVISAIAFFSRTLQHEYVAKVNGEPIEEKEFLRQLNLERATTANYFKQKYNAEVNGDFWTRNFGGEVPAQYAKERTLKECISVKVQQALAKEQGLIEDITYSTFLKKLAEENKTRKDAVKNHQVIYGPGQYDENGYFSHMFSNLVIQLKEKLLDSEFKPSDAELRKYYEKVKDIHYKKEDTVEFQAISISYGKEGGAFEDTERKEAIERMKEIKARIDKGESFENIAKSNPDEIKVETKKVNDDSASAYSKSAPQLFEAIRSISANQVSDVLDEINQRKVEIIKVIKREGGGYKAYEEFKDSLLLNYSSEKYNELLEKRIKEATIEINERAYRNLKIQ